MKIHYLVLAHNNPQHLTELVQALAPHPVYIHLDSKSESKDFAAYVKSLLIDQRVNVMWAGWSLVEATLLLMQEVLPFLEDDDYVVLLSGDSYPLQTQQAIRDFLISSNNTQFMNVVPMPSAIVEKPISRVSRFYLEYDQRDQHAHFLARVVNKLSLPRPYKLYFKDLEPYCGSQWWALTGEMVKWMLAEIPRRQKFIHFAKNTRVPDEWFFQTLLMSSHLSAHRRKSLMFADFTAKSGPRPSLMTKQHIATIGAAVDQSVEHQGYGSGPVLFARKFSDASVEERNAVRSDLWSTTVRFRSR